MKGKFSRGARGIVDVSFGLDYAEGFQPDCLALRGHLVWVWGWFCVVFGFGLMRVHPDNWSCVGVGLGR